ncbi:MAG: DUF3277 family protein, partial [Deltaproteobacteria bacterium]
YADDEFIAVERMTDTWMDSAGTDGFVTRARSGDNRGTITVTLSQTSPTNDEYQALAIADELTGNAAAYGLLRDASGRTICSADTAWIVKPPAVTFGRSPTNRVWVFRCSNLIVGAGGNPQ